MTVIEIIRRNYNIERLLPNDLKWEVVNYSNKAYGGPFEAEIHVSGPDESLWELLNTLRDKISFRDDMGEVVWWGYIAEVEVTARNPLNPDKVKTRVGVSLDSMFNRVAIAWEDIAVGTQAGERKTTDWVQDDFSISEYAKKEGLFSGTSASDQTLAERARDTLLIRKKYPIALIDLNVSGDSMAIIRCRGWWDTLNWLYCAVPIELAFAYTTVTYNFGLGRTGYEKIAQAISPTGGDVNVSSIKIYARYTGAPTDDITVSLFTNPDDLTPTTLIQDGSAIANADITGTYQWLESTFSPEVVLTSGERYFLVIGRSGAVDDTNYFEIGIEYPLGVGTGITLSARGPMVYYDGAAWNTYAGYVAFMLYSNDIILTSTQVVSMLSQYGQFFPRIYSEVDSGVLSESYRDGDGTAHFEIEELLSHGTVRGRRMLSRVTIDRQAIIYEEDEDKSANYYSILVNGSMLDNYGMPVRRSLARAGVYARMVDAIPATVDTNTLGNAAKGFIEINEYDCKNDVNIYTWRDELDPFVVGRPLDG